MDTTRTGPLWLLREEVANLVCSQIQSCSEENLYNLHAWVVMGNHVHFLIEPLVQPSEAMRRIEGRTARATNLLLGRTGEPFWQAESYDRWMRDADEESRVVRYIEN